MKPLLFIALVAVSAVWCVCGCDAKIKISSLPVDSTAVATPVSAPSQVGNIAALKDTLHMETIRNAFLLGAIQQAKYCSNPDVEKSPLRFSYAEIESLKRTFGAK